MMKNKILTLLVALSFVSIGNSFYVGQIMGPANPQYIQEYFDRMWGWYNKKFFNFSHALKSEEIELIQLWREDLKQWGEEIDENFYKEHFQFSHKVVDGKPNHSLFFISSPTWSQESLNKIKEVMRLHKIKIEDSKIKEIYGLQWNVQEGLVSLFFKKEKQVEVITYKNSMQVSQITEKGISDYQMPLNLNRKDVVGISQRQILGGESILQLRLKSFFVPYLSPEALYISQQHFMEFNQLLDFVEIQDKENYILHYP